MAGTFGSRAYRFYTGLSSPPTPRGVEVLNPYTDRSVRRYLRAFLGRFFADDERRVLVLGINPGRFGAGITGVTFTDPVVLADVCGISNALPRRRELSSVFIYDFIARYGDPAEFYRRFFLTAVCPLGFVREGVNLNYYDVPVLVRSVTPFITRTLGQQISLGARTGCAIVLGLGDNRRFLERLNEEHGFFDRIVALEHPRWIMQYRRKRLDFYLEKYLEGFTAAVEIAREV